MGPVGWVVKAGEDTGMVITVITHRDSMG